LVETGWSADEQGPWGKPRGNGGTQKPNRIGSSWPPSNGPDSGGAGGGKPTPPGDFDDFLGDMRRQFSRWFGEGKGGRGPMLLAGVALFLWLASGLYQLQPGEQGVVTRFGLFDRITGSGLHYRLPAPFETLYVVNSGAVRMEALGALEPGRHPQAAGDNNDEILMLTGDENIITLSFNVQWKIYDPQAFLFSMPNPAETVREVAESAMREVIGRTKLNSALTEGKSRIQEDARALVQETLDRYHAGIRILQVNLLDAGFPQAVVDAARDVQAARADQERARNEAEAYTNDILPRARGQAARLVQEAEAYKQEVVARAQGDAARFMSVYEAYKQGGEGVMRKRIYLETMTRLLEGANKIVLDAKPGATPYLMLPDWRKASVPLEKQEQEKENP
jgi:membrane protease subunit HflK